MGPLLVLCHNICTGDNQYIYMNFPSIVQQSGKRILRKNEWLGSLEIGFVHCGYRRKSSGSTDPEMLASVSLT
jgi:hypothetical protein